MLKYENGEYTFWHLTFQEFLTADYIVDNYTDKLEAIRPFWNNAWYREVVELYIGYLSIESKKTANDIVVSALNSGDKGRFNCWRLASRSLIDIPEKRRIDAVVKKSRERMIDILNDSLDPEVLSDTGEILGWLGDTRDLKEFIEVEGGEYELEDIGKVEIKPFEISKYPVTNIWFEEFIKKGGYRNK